MAFRCRECGSHVGGRNPEKCPVCGFTVFEPVDSKPGAGELITENFDTQEAIMRLQELESNGGS